MKRIHEKIEKVTAGNLQVLKRERWLQYLVLTEERRVNLERISSVADRENKVLAYVCRTLELLEGLKIENCDDAVILAETLKWCEVAKCGLPHKRTEWLKNGYNLFAHNLGSAEIYRAENPAAQNGKLIYTLIRTHGLVGQYIRGEVPLGDNKALHDLIVSGVADGKRLKTLLSALNYCVIGAADIGLWNSVAKDAESAIGKIVAGDFQERDFKLRLKALRGKSIANGEDFEAEYAKLQEGELQRIEELIENAELWYVEAALYDFTFTECIKILIFLRVFFAERENKEKANGGNARYISFEPLMNCLYYDYLGKKRINVYKKRIIEAYLAAISLEDILAGKRPDFPHGGHEISADEKVDDTFFFAFTFSPAGEKLIGFCVEAEKAGAFYEKAVVLLFDLFELRRDRFDRFNNEERYLSQMNDAMNHKKVLLDYITGHSVLDIGPGGGGLMDLIEGNRPDLKVTGVDFSRNVVEMLRKRKQKENRKWDIVFGDALELAKTFKRGEADTIIFSSVLHELFSYIPYEGEKFNAGTVEAALRSAFDILPPGGRIIIRDGIKTEPEEQNRILRFRSGDGILFLKKYAADFLGRKIMYAVTGHNEAILPVSDAMEFLYTYTWGEESYVHEVQEQFGYFTPTEYRECIKRVIGTGGRIAEFKHFLQSGYADALLPKVDIFDESGRAVPFPDSTCIIVIEKKFQEV